MANTVFNNKVIEAKAKDLLVTGVNTRSLMSVDNSLTETAGMIKTINTYTYNGTAEEVAEGMGNTERGSIGYVGKDYTVKMIQQAFDYNDEDFLKDNNIVDMGIKGATEVMTNKLNDDFFTQLTYGTLSVSIPENGFGYDAIVDAISKINVEDESKLFIIIPNEWKALLRKDEDYKTARMGEVIYNGQVGTVAGIPVIATKALGVGEAFVMTNEAVKLFMKKEVEVEQDRDADKRKNSIYLRTAYVCALVDDTKICRITE